MMHKKIAGHAYRVTDTIPNQYVTILIVSEP